MKNEESRVITNNDVADKTNLAYVRCSTLAQNEDTQLSAMKDLCIYKLFVEKASARDTQRPMLQNLLSYAREGDTIYCFDFSRISRSLADLLSITQDLEQRGIRLVSLKENLDTSSATGRLMLGVIASVNQFQLELLHEKQKIGIELAKQQKKFKGRKKIEKPANWNEVYSQYMTRQIKAKQAMEMTGLKRNTFFAFVNQERGGVSYGRYAVMP